MSYYKLRLDIDESINMDDIIEFIQLKCNSYAYCIEGIIKDNPHMHWYLDLKCSSEVIRKKIRELGFKGNKSYSLTSLDEQYPMEYLAYMFKESKVKSWNIPDDIIENAKIQQKKVSDEIKVKKESRKSILDKLTEQCLNMKIDFTDYYSKKIIMDVILTYHLDNKLLINVNRVISLYHTLRLRIDKDFKFKLIDEILHRI